MIDVRRIELSPGHYVVLLPGALVDYHGPDEALARYLEKHEIYQRDQYEIVPPSSREIYRGAMELARRYVLRRGGRLYILDSKEAIVSVLVSKSRHRLYVRIIRLHEAKPLEPEPQPKSFDPES